MVSIRRAVALPNDIDSMAGAADREDLGLVARLAADYRADKNRFDGPGEGLWAARRDGVLIGVCGLNQDPFAEPAELAGRVRRLYVRPECRRQGVAAALLDAVEEQARSHFAILAAFTTDERAQAFYRGRGYETITGVTKRSFQLVCSSPGTAKLPNG